MFPLKCFMCKELYTVEVHILDVLCSNVAAANLGSVYLKAKGKGKGKVVPVLNTLATGYGDFRTSVAKRRRRATEVSVFPYGWMEEGVGFVMC